MKSGLKRGAVALILAALPILCLSDAGWANPPNPPGYGATPSVPVGGPGVTVATTLAIALYGIWKSRK
ncbi:MAG TPA: hypothetical protein DCZ75_15525 [Geobacter sp.]|nr:hypothetical protein [Geobacter sp.]